MTTEIIPASGVGGIDIRPIGELQVSSQAATALQEIQGAIFLAKQFPRNENQCFGKLMEACKRKTLAEKAAYSFPRGGATVSGPSVNIARVAAQIYGNVRWGLDILRADEDDMTIEGWAWDIENNVKVTAQDNFKKLVFRKSGGWVKPDERDLRELVNRRGAILVRNCLLQILPKDLIEDALAMCRKILKSEIKDPKGEAKRMIVQFSDYGVSVEQLQEYTGQTEWDADTLVELQEILTAIKDGVAKPKEYFGKKEEVVPEKPTPTIDPKNMSAGDATTHQGYQAPTTKKAAKSEPPAQEAPHPAEAADTTAYIDAKQLEYFDNLCHSRNLDPAAVRIYLKEFHDVDGGPAKIPSSQYEKIFETIKKINESSINNLKAVDPKLL